MINNGLWLSFGTILVATDVQKSTSLHDRYDLYRMRTFRWVRMYFHNIFCAQMCVFLCSTIFPSDTFSQKLRLLGLSYKKSIFSGNFHAITWLRMHFHEKSCGWKRYIFDLFSSFSCNYTLNNALPWNPLYTITMYSFKLLQILRSKF